MKDVLLVSFLLFSGCSISFAPDTLNHFAFSASLTSVGIIEQDGDNVAETTCFVVGLGLMKEIYDSIWGTGFDTSDLISDFAGAGTGAFVTAKMINREEFP